MLFSPSFEVFDYEWDILFSVLLLGRKVKYFMDEGAESRGVSKSLDDNRQKGKVGRFNEDHYHEKIIHVCRVRLSGGALSFQITSVSRLTKTRNLTVRRVQKFFRGHAKSDVFREPPTIGNPRISCLRPSLEF